MTTGRINQVAILLDPRAHRSARPWRARVSFETIVSRVKDLQGGGTRPRVRSVHRILEISEAPWTVLPTVAGLGHRGRFVVLRSPWREASDGTRRVGPRDFPHSTHSQTAKGPRPTAPPASSPGQCHKGDRSSNVQCASTEPTDGNNPITTHVPPRSLEPTPLDPPPPASARTRGQMEASGKSQSSTAGHGLLCDRGVHSRSQSSTPGHARRPSASLRAGHTPITHLLVKQREADAFATHRGWEAWPSVRCPRAGDRNVRGESHAGGTPITHLLVKQREADAFATHHGWEAWPSVRCPRAGDKNVRGETCHLHAPPVPGQERTSSSSSGRRTP